MSYQQFPILGPFGGFQDNLPKPHTPANSFDEITNWFCRKGRFHTRCRLNGYSSAPDGAIIRKMITFQDVVNGYHTLVLTTKTPYALTAGPVWNTLTLPSPLTDLSGTNLPYGVVSTNKRVFFSNGSVPILYADGEASVKVAGDVPGAARFLATNSFHLVAAYTTEPAPGGTLSVEYPNRVRWSASGDPTDWTSFSAGFEDLLEVSDSITGLATLGVRTFIFRTNGITVMTPTDNALAPFRFDNYAIAEQGIGNKYPYSLASYNDSAAFISDSEIYKISPNDFTPIGSKAKKSIFADLKLASGDVVSGYAVGQIGKGLDFLSYWLDIPGVSTWIYSFDDDAWTKFASASGHISALQQVVTP